MSEYDLARRDALWKALDNFFVYTERTATVDDFHFDDIRSEFKKEPDLLEFSCQVLADVRRGLDELPALSEVQHALIMLPVEESSEITTWDDSLLENIIVDDLEPAIIMMKRRDAFGGADESYTRILDLPIVTAASLAARFMSYRSFHPDPRAPRDFANILYIVASREPKP